MKYIILILLIISVVALSIFSIINYKNINYRENLDATLLLSFSSRHCSGTAISKNAVLTAEHCYLPNAPTAVRIDDIEYIINDIITDNNDHAILILDNIQFKIIACFSTTEAIMGEDIYMIGNPLMYTNMLRRGYVTRQYSDATIYDMKGWFGDSGAAIFDNNHKIKAMFSQMLIHPTSDRTGALQFSRSFTFKFTENQLKPAEIKNDCIGILKSKK